MNMNRTIQDDLLPKLQDRYARRSRAGKTRLLEDLGEDYDYERKYAIKLLGDTVPLRADRRIPAPNRATRSSSRWCAPSGWRPSRSAANAWRRRGRCGCRITSVIPAN